jgi:hypothetical protein
VIFSALMAALVFVSGRAALAEEASVSRPSPEVHAIPLPDNTPTVHTVIPYPTLAWVALQALPSPEIAIGRQHRIDEAGGVDETMSTTWGLRWQLTPVLWSFGVHHSQTRWRTFVVDPLARQSGSIEFSTTFEYIGGNIDRFLVRPGVRAYFPLLQRGEYLSTSIGTSVYDYDGFRVAYDVGVYTFGGLLGLQMTLAPTHRPLAAIGTIRVRYF